MYWNGAATEYFLKIRKSHLLNFFSNSSTVRTSDPELLAALFCNDQNSLKAYYLKIFSGSGCCQLNGLPQTFLETVTVSVIK